MVNITLSDIKKREINRQPSTVLEFATDNCRICFESANSTKSIYDIRDLLKECAKSSANSNEYVEQCIQLVENTNNPELNTILKEEVLPKVDSYILRDLSNSDSINESSRELVNEQIESNKICDRIIDNHNDISNRYDFSNLLEKCKDPEIITDKVCEVVNSFDIPGYAKVQTAIEESSYLFMKNHINENQPNRVRLIEDFFRLADEIHPEDKSNIDAVVKASPLLKPETKDILLNPAPKRIIIFKTTKVESPDDHEFSTPEELFDHTINYSDANNAGDNFSRFFHYVLNYIVVNSGDEDNIHIKTILFYQIPKMYDLITEKKKSDPDLDKIITAISGVLSIYISKLNTFVDNIDNGKVAINLKLFKDDLETLQDKFSDAKDIVYPRYNIESMTYVPLKENKFKISLSQYKKSNYGPFTSKVQEAEKIVAHKFHENTSPLAEEYKIHQEYLASNFDNIYESILESGNIDMEFASYSYEKESDPNLHKELCEVCRDINDSILKDTYYKCYYEMTDNLINFRLRDTTPVSLDEEEIATAESYITEANLERMYNIYIPAQFTHDNYNIKEDAIRYFSKNPDHDLFETFLEYCSICEIPKDTVESIYESVLSRVNNKIGFITNNSYLIDSYQPEEDIPTNIIFESFGGIQSLLLESDPQQDIQDRLKKYGYKEEDDREPSEEDKRKIQQIKSGKVKPAGAHEIVQKKPDPNSYDDTIQNEPQRNMTGNNAKLVTKGIGNRLADIKNHDDQAARGLDAKVNMFIKACKKALISDRREAIIKGSIIPSFSKALRIGIALIGLGAGSKAVGTHLAGKSSINFIAKHSKFIGKVVGILTPMITAFGGMAISKQLTRKERLLMLDDIQVELKVLDKEIQMADQNNQINKYRALLKIQRDLQREENRIKYGISNDSAGIGNMSDQDYDAISSGSRD